MDKIKNGDLVQLKSGGPTMTVVDADDEKDITVNWFHPTSPLSAAAIDGQTAVYEIMVQEAHFPVCALKVVESA